MGRTATTLTVLAALLSPTQNDVMGDTILVGFEQFDVGTQLSDQLRNEGVLFRSGQYDPSQSGSFIPSLPYVEVVDDFVPFGERAILSPPRSLQNDVLVTFVVPGTNIPGMTQTVSVFLDTATPFDFGDDLVHLRAFDVSGSPLAVDTLPDTAAGALEVSAPEIHYAIIDYERRSTDAGEHYDNLSFHRPTIIPLPAAVWLGLAMLGGMGVVGGIRRKPRRS